MESSYTPVPRRPFLHRALLWGASCGALAGAGWGIWQVTTPAAAADSEQAEATGDEAPSIDAQAQHQIDRLFVDRMAEPPSPSSSVSSSSNNQAAPASPAHPTGESTATDRYAVVESEAPPLPPMAQQSTAETQAVSATARVADRYAQSSAPSLSPAPAPAAGVESPTDDRNRAAPLVEEAATLDPPLADEPDVARGQGPDNENPLRDVRQTVATEVASPDQARSAFDQSPTPRQAPTVASIPVEVDQASPAYRDARPLPRADRYSNHPAPPLPMGEERSLLTPGAAPPAVRAPALPDSAEAMFAESARRQPTQPTQPVERPAASAPPATRDFSAPDYTSASVGAPPAADGVTPTPGLAAATGVGRPGERVLEGPQSPAITIQKLAPPEIQVGKKCTFAIRVKNNGQRAAQHVIVHDEVPLGTQLIGAAPRAAVSGAQVQWDLGTLSVGEERIVEMELLPTDEGDLGSVAMVTFAAEASAKARCTKPELRLRLTCKPRVMVGNQHLVQVEITNPGSGDATGVMLLESLPEGVSHEAGSALEFEVGTLKAGETRELDLVLTAEQAGLIDNVMTARADANLQSTASCQFEIIAPALALTVEGPKRKYLERPATFVVNIDNPGTASAKEVQLVAQLPKGLQYVDANHMGEYDQATHSVYWSLAELPANERGSVQLTALPVSPGEHTIRAATKALQGLEDRAERLLQVEGMAALSFETQFLENLIEIGGETSCEIRVTNRGSKAASNVQVVALMPPGLRAVSAKGDTQNSLQGNQVAFAPLLQLAPGAEAIFMVSAQGVSPGDQRVKVRITSDDEEPITKEASARVYADQ